MDVVLGTVKSLSISSSEVLGFAQGDGLWVEPLHVGETKRKIHIENTPE
jgi:hypothetical protein